MNKARRKKIDKAVEFINTAISNAEEAKNILESCKDGETEYRENMPESLQNSEKASIADEAIDNLESADSFLETAIDALEEIISTLGDASGSAESATG